jgi:hypothetical protein
MVQLLLLAALLQVLPQQATYAAAPSESAVHFDSLGHPGVFVAWWGLHGAGCETSCIGVLFCATQQSWALDVRTKVLRDSQHTC